MSSGKQNFVFVSSNETGPWGGSEELWSQSARMMTLRGICTHACVLKWEPTPRPIADLERLGCHVIRRAHRSNPPMKPVYELAQDERWKWELRSLNPELVLISQGDNLDGLGWMESCIAAQIPYAVVSHSGTEYEWPDDEIMARLQIGYQRARRCFFVSDANFRLTEMQIASPLPNAKVVRVPYKVSYDVSLNWPSYEDGVRLAMPARLDPASKGQDILFEVLRLSKWRERDVRVTLFGTGNNSKNLMALADLWNINQVTFAGYEENVESIWTNHHALVLPSRVEGLPAVIVEAMLCGRICIVTGIAGNGELLEDNQTGFIAAAPHMRFFDEALERAWQKRAFWPALGKLAAEAIRKKVPANPVEIFVDELQSCLEI